MNLTMHEVSYEKEMHRKKELIMQAILWKIILMEEGKMWKDNDDRMVKMLDEIDDLWAEIYNDC